MFVAVFRLAAFLWVGGYSFFQACMPTNHLVRWLRTDDGIKWGLPVGGALTLAYWLVCDWSRAQLEASGPTWLWLLATWGAINTIKFAHVAISSPFIRGSA